MNFEEIVLECCRNQALVSEFDRLTGSNLSLRGKPIELMVDQATGKLADDVAKFVAFVYECVWLRLPREEVNE